MWQAFGSNIHFIIDIFLRDCTLSISDGFDKPHNLWKLLLFKTETLSFFF